MEADQDKIRVFLSEEGEKVHDDLQELYVDFETFWERKLWHQLTERLLEFFERPESGPNRIPIYKNFVLTFADKVNHLKLVSLALSALSQIKDNNEALAFLETVKAKVNKPASQDAYVYALVESARIKLLLKDLDGARDVLNEAEKILERFDSVESVVHASFYRVNADYFSVKHEFTDYYRNALLYLACIQDSDLSVAEQQERAYNLSVSALLSKDIYNFGELLLHPILDSLKNTPHSWLRDLLFAFNSGDLQGFMALSNNLSKEPLFAQQENFLREKICLSALAEAVSRRPPQERTLSFETIVQETRVHMEEVEHLLMKALSLGLIRGTIDQVSNVVRVTWVQPKVLDKAQIENMRLRLLDWSKSVGSLGQFVGERTEQGTVF